MEPSLKKIIVKLAWLDLALPIKLSVSFMLCLDGIIMFITIQLLIHTIRE